MLSITSPVGKAVAGAPIPCWGSPQVILTISAPAAQAVVVAAVAAT